MHMKRNLSCLLAAAAFYACGPANKPEATITADITGLKDTVIYISQLVADSSKTDTVPVVNGKFTWTGNITEPEKIYLMFPDRYVDLFMEPSHVTITGHADSLTNLHITGSASHDEYQAYQQSQKGIEDQMGKLYENYDKIKDNDSAMAVLESKSKEIRTQRRNGMKRYISEHPKSVVSVSLVTDMAVMGEYKQLDSLYKLLDPAAQQTGAGVRLGKRIAVLKKSAVGEPFIDFTLPDAEGKAVKFSDFKGKYVLLDFWASWCGPCRAENPNVLKAFNAYKDKNFIVVGVSLDDDGEKWKKAIAEDGMPWIQLSDLKGFRNTVAQEYGIQAIPSTFLVSPEGIIVEKDLRGAALHKKLAELLN